MPGRDHLGGKIGPRLADLMSRAVTAQLGQSAHTRARIHAAGLDHFWHGINRELRQVIGPHLEEIIREEDLDPHLERLLRFVATQPGEGSGMLGMLWYGTGAGATFGQLFNPWLAPVVHKANANHPVNLLQPDELAMLAARGVGDYAELVSEAAGSAISETRFDLMMAGNYDWGGLATTLELLNRRELSDAEAQKFLHRQGVAPELRDIALSLARQLLQPADLALMALRGIITEEEGRQRAKLTGVDAGDFDLLVGATGEPPGLEQLLEAYRRGFVDQHRLERGIRQSRVRNEWIDVVEKLRFSPADTSDAVRAVVQDQLSDAEGQSIARQNGLEPAHWDWLVRSYGEPIAHGQALELLNRGEMTTREVEQAIRESRVKNKYIPTILKLKRRLPPERTIITMLAHGALSHEEAIRLLLEQGFERQIAEAIVKAGTAQRTTHVKHLTVTEIQTLFGEAAITRPEAEKTLEQLGYDAHDAGLILKVGQLRAEATFRRQAATRIGTDYVDRLIDRATTAGYLEKIGLPSSHREELLALWDLERSARRKTLTGPQIVAGYTHGQLTAQEALDRLVALGYDQLDAEVLLRVRVTS